jgi:hypothetical protein
LPDQVGASHGADIHMVCRNGKAVGARRHRPGRRVGEAEPDRRAGFGSAGPSFASAARSAAPRSAPKRTPRLGRRLRIVPARLILRTFRRVRGWVTERPLLLNLENEPTPMRDGLQDRPRAAAGRSAPRRQRVGATVSDTVPTCFLPQQIMRLLILQVGSENLDFTVPHAIFL